MKRLFTIGLMLASAFALTNCSEELVAPGTLTDQVTQDGVNSPESSKGVPFTIYASAGSEADTKTQVVRDENGKTLKTEWVEGDRIYVVYEDMKDRFYGPIEFTVDPANPQGGKFTTKNFPADVLEDVDGKYNWYFTYGFKSLSVDGSGNVTATAEIPSIQEQNMTSGKELEHLAINCPMLGKALNLSGSIFPKVQMKHLATLHEVNVQNKTQTDADKGTTAGPITFDKFEVTASTEGVWDKSDRISLTGTYKIDLKNDKRPFSNYGGSSDKITMKFDSEVTIESGKECKLYFVTAPIEEIKTEVTYVKYYQSANGDILTETDYKELNNTSGYTDVTMVVATLYKNATNANNVITQAKYDALPENDKDYYNAFTTPEIDRHDIFTFTVNKASRTVQTGKTFTNFKGGVVKRFELPICEMHRPVTNNAVNQFVTVNASSISLDVNGSNLSGWSFTEGNSLIMTGTVPELFNALDAGFYASCWNNAPTAMTISRMQLIIENKKLSQYDPLKNVLKTEIQDDVSRLLAGTAVRVVLGSIDDGIKRDKGTFDFLTLTQFIHPATITFTGLIPNGVDMPAEGESPSQILILDEEPYHKSISKSVLDSFLGSRFVVGDKLATAQGLIDIANGNDGTDAAKNTSYVLYNVLKSTFETFGDPNNPGIMTKSIDVGITVTVDIDMRNVYAALIPEDKQHTDYNLNFNNFLRNIELELEVIPCSYIPNIAYYGDKSNPVTVKAMKSQPGAVSNPIIFWGINTYGPNSSY